MLGSLVWMLGSLAGVALAWGPSSDALRSGVAGLPVDKPSFRRSRTRETDSHWLSVSVSLEQRSLVSENPTYPRRARFAWPPCQGHALNGVWTAGRHVNSESHRIASHRIATFWAGRESARRIATWLFSESEDAWGRCFCCGYWAVTRSCQKCCARQLSNLKASPGYAGGANRARPKQGKSAGSPATPDRGASEPHPHTPYSPLKKEDHGKGPTLQRLVPTHAKFHLLTMLPAC
jgi:hypothetical protein